MTRFGWKFPLAAALAVLVNLGVSHSASADLMEIKLTSSADPGTTLDIVAPAGSTNFSINSTTMPSLLTMFPELSSVSISISTNQGSGLPSSSLQVGFDLFRNNTVAGAVTYTLSGSDLNYLVPAGTSKVLQTTVSGNFNNGTSPPTTLSDVGSAGTTNTKFLTSVSNPALGPFTPMSTGLSSFNSTANTPTNLFTGPTPFSITNVLTFTTNAVSETTAQAITTVGSAVPEPTSIVLGAFALPFLVFLRRRRATA